MTIRRDLEILASEGLLHRTHGGAVHPAGGIAELSIDVKRASHPLEKRQIAEIAVQFVEPGMSVLLDAGTTTLPLAERLVDRVPLRVLTTDLTIARLLSDTKEIEVYMIGGLVKPEIYSTDGELAIQMLSSLFVDIAFIGCDSFTSEVAMSRSVHKAALKRAMMKAAHRKILLADSSKFGQHSFQRIAELQEFDAVVTDAAFPEDAREVLADLGIDLVLPNVLPGHPECFTKT